MTESEVWFRKATIVTSRMARKSGRKKHTPHTHTQTQCLASSVAWWKPTELWTKRLEMGRESRWPSQEMLEDIKLTGFGNGWDVRNMRGGGEKYDWQSQTSWLGKLSVINVKMEHKKEEKVLTDAFFFKTAALQRITSQTLRYFQNTLGFC